MVAGSDHYSSGGDTPCETKLLMRAQKLNQTFYKEHDIPYKSIKEILIARDPREVGSLLFGIGVRTAMTKYKTLKAFNSY